MKRYFFYITITLFFRGTISAQILFSNSFGNLTLQSYTSGTSVSKYAAAPGVFSLINDGFANNAGTINNINVPFHVPALKNAGWTVAYNANVNDTFLVSTSWHDDVNLISDNWIVTSSVTVGPNTVFTWLAMSPDANYPDGYEVYGTTKTGVLTPTDFTIGDRLFALPYGVGTGEKNTWTRRSVSLGIFSGQNLRFAFRNNSKNMFQLWIDDIEIRTPFYNLEAEMASIVNEKYILKDTLQSVGVNITNLGSTTINTLVLNYQYGTSQPNTQTFVVAGGLNYLQTANFNFALKYSISTAGYYPLKSWISSVDGALDQNLGSDTIKTYVTVQASSPVKNILVEQFVSANNGDCPDAQQQGLVLEVLSNALVVVNIHDNDSLKELNSTGVLSDYRKNFATGMIDRLYYGDLQTNAISTSYYGNKIVNRLKAVTPANVSIINKTYNSGTKQLAFTIRAEFFGEVKGDYRINAYLSENNVSGKATDSTVNDYNQLNNYYNVPWSPFYLTGYFSAPYNAYVMDAWRFKHQNVLVYSFDGSYGNSGTIPSAGGTIGNAYQKTFTLTVPTPTNGELKYNSDNLYIVGFVAEYNADKYKRNILNVVKEKVTSNAEVVGVKENPADVKINMYPNPCAKILYFNGLNLNKNYEIKICDVLGECVFRKIIENVNITECLNLAGISSGIYIVEVNSGNKIFKEKLVIQGN